MRPRVLAVDDNHDALYALEQMLKAQGYEVVTASNGRETLERFRSNQPDIVLLDLVMPELDGLEVIRRARSEAALRYTPIILLTGKDSLDDVIAGLEAGADDYIAKPFEEPELLARLNAALRTRKLYQDLKRSEDLNVALQREAAGRHGSSQMVGQSAAIKELQSIIEKVADATAPVLITGESGTGKELVARALHYRSGRSAKPFIAQNCAALSESLLESEFFGYVRGAFTGANRDKPGIFELADGGTLFLDELGEMSPALQAKLLRVLQDGTFFPVGASAARQVDVRVVAATNRDLEQQAKAGKFREDLYYRVSVVTLRTPPLRERREDIPHLIEHFYKNWSQKYGRTKELAPDCQQFLVAFDWPGNVRQLYNELERLALLSGHEQVISASLLSPQIRSVSAPSVVATTGKLKDAMEGLERQLIAQALERAGGNKSEAARELGISRSNLIAKVQEYGLS